MDGRRVYAKGKPKRPTTLAAEDGDDVTDLAPRCGGFIGRVSTTTRDFTAAAAENAENGRKHGNGTKTTGELDSKAQRSSPFSAFSAVKK